MNKEMLKYFKHLVEITEKSNRNTPLEMQVGVEIPVEMAKTLLKIIEKKDKIIDLMAEEMNNNYDFDGMCVNCKNDACLDGKADYGKECVKEYFKNKVKEN